MQQFDAATTSNRPMIPNAVIKLIARFLVAINWPVRPGSLAEPLGGFEMVVERECFACGSSERLIAGPGDLAFCHRCTTLADTAGAIAYSGPCAFCDTQIGRRIGFINRRTLTAPVVTNGLAVCNECLALLKDIVAEGAPHDT